MVASSTPEAIAKPRIEVDAKENGSLHESTETAWHVSDDHKQALSFSDVHPADITVRNLGVEVDIVTSVVDALKAKFTKSKVGDVEGDVVGGTRRKILKDVSGVFPAGTLTAIIGASGSGKVRPSPSYTILGRFDLTCSSRRQPSSTFSRIVCGDQTSLSPEAHNTTDPPIFSQSLLPMSPKPTS